MRRDIGKIRLALIALFTLALVHPALAQEPPKDLIAFKATETGVVDLFVIPMDPPLMTSRFTAMVESNQGGPYKAVGSGLWTVGVDGTPLAFEGFEVLTAANGDALFVRYHGLIRPPTKPGVGSAEAIWTVTGGRGRFLGASGSGVQRFEGDPATGKYTASFEGSLRVAKSVP